MSDIARPVRRGKIFYYRKRVPHDLRAALRSWVINKSLRTDLPSVAQLRYGWLDIRVQDHFGWIRQQMENGSSLSDDDIREGFHKLLKTWLGMLPAPGKSFAAPLPVNPETSIELLESQMRNEDGELYDIGVNLVQAMPELEHHWSGLDEAQTMQIGYLGVRVVREHFRQMQALARDGRFSSAFDAYFDAALPPGSTEAAAPATPKSQDTHLRAALPSVEQGLTPNVPSYQDQVFGLRANYQQFASETGSDWGRRRYKFDEVCQIMCDIFGDSFDMRNVTPHDVRRVKDLIRRQPVRANTLPEYKTLSITDQVKLADKANAPRVTYKTANDKLGNISLWFKWAKANLYIEQNLFEGIRVEGSKKSLDGRAPFSNDQLRRFFSSQFFTGVKSTTRWTQVGDIVFRDLRYWGPLISVHSGMRLEEIAQLKIRHIDEVDGIWCFNLKGADLQVKTDASARLVPIHSNLWDNWRLGAWFRDQSAKRPPDAQLFIETAPDTTGRYGSKLSRWFSRYLEFLGLKSPQLTFHSFRHTFMDFCRDAEIDYPVMKALVGHEAGDVTGGYGKGYGVKVLHTAIEKIEMPFTRPDT